MPTVREKQIRQQAQLFEAIIPIRIQVSNTGDARRRPPMIHETEISIVITVPRRRPFLNKPRPLSDTMSTGLDPGCVVAEKAKQKRVCNLASQKDSIARPHRRLWANMLRGCRSAN